MYKKSSSDFFTDYLGYNVELNSEQREVLRHYVDNEIISDSKQVRYFNEKEFELVFSKSGVIQLLHELVFRCKQVSCHLKWVLKNNLSSNKRMMSFLRI